MNPMDQNRLRAMLRKADENGYAVPAFNFTDVWDMQAIVQAAEELSAPVMIMSIPKTTDSISPEVFGAAGCAMMKSASVPVVLHLDHSKSVELCKRAIDAGYPSVMIDASLLPLEENIAAIREVVEYAHPRGVHVEGEIGKIKGKDYESNYSGDDYLVNVEEAVRLVRETGVDSLAVGVGTAHGFYQGKPDINFDRLAECNNAIDIPLVLHGGTGIPEEDVRKAIQNGINKMNVGTIVRHTYMNRLKEVLNGLEEMPHTAEIMEQVRPAIIEVIKRWIKVCMADGKA